MGADAGAVLVVDAGKHLEPEVPTPPVIERLDVLEHGGRERAAELGLGERASDAPVEAAMSALVRSFMTGSGTGTGCQLS